MVRNNERGVTDLEFDEKNINYYYLSRAKITSTQNQLV
jgi:hypothetical protein